MLTKEDEARIENERAYAEGARHMTWQEFYARNPQFLDWIAAVSQEELKRRAIAEAPLMMNTVPRYEGPMEKPIKRPWWQRFWNRLVKIVLGG